MMKLKFPSVTRLVIGTEVMRPSWLNFFMLSLLCAWGTSCNRNKEIEPVEEKLIKVREFVQCENDCIFARDGECDDGGPESTTNYCSFGHDCKDCSERITIEVEK